jgi:hypothetical protein
MKLLRPLLISAALLLGSTLSGHSAHQMGNGICETTTTAGTGTVNLAGTYTPYSTFVSQITSGNTVTYRITTGSGASLKVETGTGTFTDGAPDTLTRDAEWTTDDQSAPITELTLAGTSTVCVGTANSTFNADKGDITFGAGFTTATIDGDSVALTTDTTGNYAAGDAEAGAALTGDSATAFFSAGTVDDARIDGSAEADEVNPTLGTQTQGNYALGDAEGGAATTGDSATSFFSTGTIEDARIDGSAEADEVNPTLGTQTQGNYLDNVTGSATTGVAVTHTPAEGSEPAVAFDFTDKGADPALSADTCVFNGDATSNGEIVCEGDTADTIETRIIVTDPTASDKTFTIGNGTTYSLADADKGDITVGTSGTDFQIDSGAVGATEAAALDAGDITTGTFADALVSGSAEADEVLNSDKTDFTCSAGSCTLDADTVADSELDSTSNFDITGSITFDSDAMQIDDTNASHQLVITPGSDLSADRVLTITTGDSARTLTLSGNATLSDADKGDITTGTSFTDWQIDADAVGANEISAGAVGTSEAAALDAGDVTTGTFADAQVSGANEADELTLAGDVDGTANSNDIDEANVEAELESVIDEADLQVSDQGTDPALSADRCAFTTDATTAGFIVCEGDTANTSESRMDFGDPSGDRVFTLPDANSWPVTDRDYGDITFSASGQTVVIDGDSVALSTDTTGNYAAGDGEAGNALTGDSATSFFSSGTIEDARIDGSAEADEVLNSDKGDFTCSSGTCGIDVWPTFNRQVVTGTGTYTPTSGAMSFLVRCQAAGGGGGGSDNDVNGMSPGAGGGGGQYAEIHYTLAEMGANAAVTIGAVGAASDTNGGAGGAAGDTTFNPAGSGGTLTVDGGGGGDGSGASNTSGYYSYDRGGAGGSVASGGDFEVDGQDGDHPYWASVYGTHKNNSWGGSGGDAVLGHGGRMADGLDDVGTDIAGVTGQSYGGGGSGAADDDTTGSAGGAGGPAICIIDELLEG